MAIAAAAVWEIRADANAGNKGGGFFVTGASGSDFSQQTAPQYALTIASSAGAGNVVTHASAAADMVGNGVFVVSGTNFTLNSWFEITSVSVGVSFTCSTNAAGASISTGVGIADGVMNIGGAMSMNSTLDDDMFEAGAAGNTYYFRQAGGIISLGETVAIALAGSTTKPITMIGYTTSRASVPTGSNRPNINVAAGALTLGANWYAKNIIFTGTSSPTMTVGNANYFVNCKFVNSSPTAGRRAFQTNIGAMCFNCEFVSIRGDALNYASVNNAQACYIHDSDRGLTFNTTGNCGVYNSIFEGMVTAAILINGVASSACHVVNSNTLYGAENKLGIGVSAISTAQFLLVMNNIIYGFATGVSHAGANTLGVDDYNDYNNNTNDVNNAANWQKGANDITTAPAFTNVTPITGIAAVLLSGNRLQDSSKNFTTLGVVANATPHVGYTDYVYYGPTGSGAATKGIYAITAITTVTNPNDTLTLDQTLTADATADHLYQITLGHNFLPTGAI